MTAFGFTKLFASILDSTVWAECVETKIVWVTLLAMSDAKGRVAASVPGLARRAGVSLEATEAALGKFMAPDPYSRSKEHEGRRIEEIDGGWRLLNHAKYRELRDAETRREQVREAVRRHRERRACNPGCNQSKPRKAQAEAEAEAEKDRRERVRRSRGTRAPSHSNGGPPSVEEWTALARERFPDWPEEDVRSAFTFAVSEGKLRARGWEAMLARLRAAHARRVTAATAKLSPAEREREETRRVIAEARERSARSSADRSPGNPLSRPATARAGAGPGLGPSGGPRASAALRGEKG